MIARPVRNINLYPLGAGVTASSPGVRLVLNPSASSASEAGGKGGKREPDVATPPSRWLWTGYSAKVCRRRHGEPAYAGYRPKGTGRPNRRTARISSFTLSVQESHTSSYAVIGCASRDSLTST
jgi:hypothetical protein